MTVKLDDWFNRILNKTLTEEKEKINNKTEACEWVRQKKVAGIICLPLFVDGNDGHKRPFHHDDIIESGEKVIFLKQK